MAKRLLFFGRQIWLRRLFFFLTILFCFFTFYFIVDLTLSSSYTREGTIQRKSTEKSVILNPFEETQRRQKNIQLLMRRARILEHVLKLNRWPLKDDLLRVSDGNPFSSTTLSVGTTVPTPSLNGTFPIHPSPLLFQYANYLKGIPLPDNVDFFLKTPARSSNRFCRSLPPELMPLRFTYLIQQRFMLVLNLFNSEDILPDFLASLLIFLSKLNPSNVHISIYENGSKDRTKSYLQALRVYLRGLSVNYSIALDDSNRPAHFHRIEYLAQVRNKAMTPLWSTQAELRAMYFNSSTHFSDERFDPKTGDLLLNDPGKPPVVDKIIFLNDVMFCPEELLELVHQSFLQNADISCGMDYTRSAMPIFYDFWVARDKHGEKWFNLPFDKILKDGDTDQEEFVNRQLPFQTFCCWNGGAVLNPLPFTHYQVRFRRGNKYPGECSASECNVMCRDFLKYGFNRTIAVPKFKVAYEHPTFESIKSKESTYVKRFQRELLLSPADDQLISFVPAPKKVLCWPMYNNDSYGPDGTMFYEDMTQLQNETALIPLYPPKVEIKVSN
ncbi:capsular associated protein [Coelomomyces lativittatus]|nr:capsular associated protein [Coelomomyces lativittatus]KAJ1515627.1 capsular associated protein [Coelomomyces lativittatus]